MSKKTIEFTRIPKSDSGDGFVIVFIVLALAAVLFVAALAVQ